METTCTDLRARFGERYRITWDEAYDPEHVPMDKRDPWYMQIPCRFGIIYPQGGDLLAAEVDRHPRLTKPLLAIAGVHLSQDGDTEKTFTFPVQVFDEIAVILQPRKKRQITEEERERLAKMSAIHGFKAPSHQSDSPLSAPASPNTLK